MHVFKPLPQARAQNQLKYFEVEGKNPQEIFCYIFDLVNDLSEEVKISNTSWKLEFEGVDKRD